MLTCQPRFARLSLFLKCFYCLAVFLSPLLNSTDASEGKLNKK